MEVQAQLARIPGRHYHILGNHDVAKLSVADNEELMQHSFQLHSTDINGYHLVFWNANAKLQMAAGFSLADADLEWFAPTWRPANCPQSSSLTSPWTTAA
jgi:hypothetical protein